MERRDIFIALGMGEYIWGNAYFYRVADLDLSVAINRFLKLDDICKAENWNPLTENTFGLSTVFVNNDKILITCFSSED